METLRERRAGGPQLTAIASDRVLAHAARHTLMYVRTPVGWRLLNGRRVDDGELVLDPGLIAALDAAVRLEATPA
jgi:hypothetical protein